VLRSLRVPLVVAYTPNPNVVVAYTDNPSQKVNPLAFLNAMVPPTSAVTLPWERSCRRCALVFPGEKARRSQSIGFSRALAEKLGRGRRYEQPIVWHGRPAPMTPHFKLPAESATA